MLVPRIEVDDLCAQNEVTSVGFVHLENVSRSVYHYLGMDLNKQLSVEKMVYSTFSKANRKLYLIGLTSHIQ